MILRKAAVWTLLGGAMLAGPCAAADAAGASYRGHARVTKVTPIVNRSQTREPVKLCTWEQLPSRTRYYPDARERRVTQRKVKRCRTEYKSRIKETTTGYNVTLNYNGETFVRRTDERPGSHMPVSIEIAPLNH